MMHKQKTEDIGLSSSSRKPSNNDSTLEGGMSSVRMKKGVEFSSSSTSQASVHTRWGKSTNLVGLYSGLQQLRCLLDTMSPGLLPTETVVGALLDLVKLIHYCNKALDYRIYIL